MAVDGEVSINTPDAASENVVKDNIQLAHTQVKRDNAPVRPDISALLGEGKEPSLVDIRDFDKDAQESEDPVERETRINQANANSGKSVEAPKSRPFTHMGEGEHMDERRTSTKDALDYFVNVSNAVTEWPGMPPEERLKVEAKWDEFIEGRLPGLARYAGEYPALERNLERLAQEAIDARKAKAAVPVEPGSAPSLNDVSVGEAPGEDTKTELEPPETPPVDLSKLNDPGAISPVSDEEDSVTSPAEDKDANGTTAFPEEDKKPAIDPNYKSPGPNFGRFDDDSYGERGPGDEHLSEVDLMRRRDERKKALANAEDKRSRWQKFKDSFKPRQKVTVVKQHPEETTSFSDEEVTTQFPEETKAEPATDATTTPAPEVTPVEPENSGTTQVKEAVSSPAESGKTPAESVVKTPEPGSNEAVSPEDVSVQDIEDTLESTINDIKILWDKIPDDKRENDPYLADLAERGSLDEYFQNAREFYKGELSSKSEKDQLFAVLNNAKAIRDHQMEIIGRDDALKIIKDAKISMNGTAAKIEATKPAEV